MSDMYKILYTVLLLIYCSFNKVLFDLKKILPLISSQFISLFMDLSQRVRKQRELSFIGVTMMRGL